ncbi:MAG TPA: transglycosylase domain-containing protein, partial [Nevskiaceae bacterium]|nr:transglycosylase domain-containing protein [Nevskiaceae bacterium]
MRIRGRLLVAGISLAGLVALERATAPPDIPSFADVKAHYRPSEATLLDRHGTVIQTVREDFTARRLEWTPLADIAHTVPDAIVASEDHRFREHGGVDWRAVAGALRDRVLGVGRRGASTLEMQLVAHLDTSLRATGARRTWRQKLRQMRAASRLDDAWTKDEVLEAYLNHVGLRGEHQGIAAASHTLFNKPPSGIEVDEAWTLAALLPSPGANPVVVGKRACRLAKRSGKACDGLRKVVLEALSSPREIAVDRGLAPHLARRLLRTPGERVTSTLDPAVQALALRALQSQLRSLDAQEVRDGAAVVVANATGDVLAYVGSAGRASKAAQVDGVRALRQAGSTLKPFLYALAIERQLITAASLLDDAPVALEAGPGLYLPQNYERDYKGLVSARTALAGSLNIPAVRTLILAGIEPFRERLHQLGFVEGLTESGDHYGFSLALGSAEVNLLEQANAYRTLANGGAWSPLRLSIPDFVRDAPAAPSRQVIRPEAAWIVA